MIAWLDASTYHRRKGRIANSFRYSVDYLWLDAHHLEENGRIDGFLSVNKLNLYSVWREDYGGVRGRGEGLAWVLRICQRRLPEYNPEFLSVVLVAQPRYLGFRFSPVSFWLIYDRDDLIAAIAEVNNTFGDRHSYWCAHEDGRPIMAGDRLSAEKIFHVSPFQPIYGGYTFKFDIRDGKIHIVIDFDHNGGGLYATLSGSRVPISRGRLLRAALRRPLGTFRVTALIYMQALVLKLKGAKYRKRPKPPHDELT